HLPLGALPALLHRLDGGQVERRLSARSDGLPEPPDPERIALDSLPPAAPALDVEQLPGDSLLRRRLDLHRTAGRVRRGLRPLSGAPTFQLIVLQATWVCTELLLALVSLPTDSARTLMAGLTQFQGRFATNEPLVLAGALISIAPVVLLYLSGQRFFVRGLTAGIGK